MTNAIAVPLSDIGFLTSPADTDADTRACLAFLARYKGRTLQGYRWDMGTFFAWCAGHGLRPLLAEEPHVQMYIRWMEAQPWAQATVNRRYTTVASFYRNCARSRVIDRNPCEWIDPPSVDVEAQKRPAPSPLELGMFIAAAEQVGHLEHALLSLLGVRGLRISEACALDVKDLTRSRSGYDQITFVGKGSKKVTIPLPMSVSRAVRAHLGTRTDGPLLLNRWRNRIDRRCAQRCIDRVAAYASLRADLTPHSFRRGMIMTLLADGTPIRDVQQAARHAKSATTERYDQRRMNDDRDATHRLDTFLAGMRG